MRCRHIMKKYLIWILYVCITISLVVTAYTQKISIEIATAEFNDCINSSETYDLNLQLEIQEDSILTLSKELNILTLKNEK